MFAYSRKRRRKMVKKELVRFSAFLENGEKIEMQPPCMLFSCVAPQEQSAEAPKQLRKRLLESFTLEAELSIGAQMLGYRGIVLSLCGLVGHCVAYINGEKKAEWLSPPERVYLPLEKKEGALSLRLCFPKRCVPADVGLLGGAELIAYPNDIFTDIYTEQVHKNGKCELYIRARTLRGVGNREAMATIYTPSGEIHYLGLMHGEGRVLLPSLHKYRSSAMEASGLYRLSVTLYEDGSPVDTAETRLGLRKLSFSKDDLTPFSMEVDDEKLFVKAARICALPAPSAEQSLACFESALSSFAKAGANTLLVTGETGFLSERVYAICDSLGLFVFQQIPMPEDTGGDLDAYFADLKTSVMPLANHPSLALLLLPSGVSPQSALGRAIKGFFAFSFPNLALRAMPETGFADIAEVPSMPSPLSVRRHLPMEARRVFSYAMESAQESADQLVSMLRMAAEELPYGASLEDVCYITGICSAERARRRLSAALERGIPGGVLMGTLFEGGIAMKPALMDGLLQKKALYFEMKGFFSPVFLDARAEAQKLCIALATAGVSDTAVQLHICLMDRANNLVRSVKSEAVLSAGAPLFIQTDFPEVLSHEREYYARVAVLSEGALLCERTVLFVPAKHFRFVYPNLLYEIKGSGRSYELTLSASAYVHRLQLSFSKTAASFSKNYFDITSDAKIVVAIETEEVTTSRHLGVQLRLRSMYDIGRISEQDLLDEADVAL